MCDAKVCTRCTRMLPIELFRPKTAPKKGRQSECRQCEAKRAAKKKPYELVHVPHPLTAVANAWAGPVDRESWRRSI